MPLEVIVLTTFDADRLVLRALRAGASGFLLKATPPEKIALVDLVAAAGRVDDEEGLDAGVEVEGFTGTARTNRPGIRVQEAVHPSQLIRLIMLCLPVTAAEREVVVPSQVLSSLTHALQSCPSGLVNGQA
jgi:CheY-like chemotaxis protein